MARVSAVLIGLSSGISLSAHILLMLITTMTNTNTDHLIDTAYSSRRDLNLDRDETMEIDAVNEGVVIPIVEEQIEIGTRQVETGRVRITKTVRSHEETIDEPILQEQVNVERVAIGRPVNETPGVRYEGDTMIVPVMEEVVVVTTQLVLKEELRITKTQIERRDPQVVTLRSEEIAVEHVSSQTIEQTL